MHYVPLAITSLYYYVGLCKSNMLYWDTICFNKLFGRLVVASVFYEVLRVSFGLTHLISGYNVMLALFAHYFIVIHLGLAQSDHYRVNKAVGNLLITELVYCLAYFFDCIPTVRCSTVRELIGRLLVFYLLQDAYFYIVHKFIMHGPFRNLHNAHHSTLEPLSAWHCHWLEHLFLHIGSFVLPWFIVPNQEFVFYTLIAQQIYTSVNGHTSDSPHSVHHRDPTRRFGSIYMFDRLFGSFWAD